MEQEPSTVAEFLASDEFRTAVDKLVAERVAAISTAPAVPGAPGDLALAIAQLVAQNSDRPYESPEIIKQRAAARERMIKLIVAARAAGVKILYGVKRKMYLCDTMVEPLYIGENNKVQDTEIEWYGEPNSAMVPLNDAAKEIFAEFNTSIAHVAKSVKEETCFITAGGLVVNGKAPPHRQVPGQQQTEESEGGLKIVKGKQPYVKTDIAGIPVMQTKAAS